MAVLQRAMTQLLHFLESFLPPNVLKLLKTTVHLFTFTSTLKMATYKLKIKAKIPKPSRRKFSIRCNTTETPL